MTAVPARLSRFEVRAAQLLRQRHGMMAVHGPLAGRRVLSTEVDRFRSAAMPDGPKRLDARLEIAVNSVPEAADYALTGPWPLIARSRGQVRDLEIAMLTAWLTRGVPRR